MFTIVSSNLETFKVHILGCGSALPTPKHNASCQIVEIRNTLIMVDCGEGAQIQLRRMHMRFTKIKAVLISHLHGDHCFGLIGMISTFGMLGRTDPLGVYAPAEFESVLNMLITTFCNNLGFKVEFHPLDTTQNTVIFDEKRFTIETIPLNHRVPCCGFLFREKPLLPHIRRDMIDFYDIPISQINNIKNGADWTTEDGEFVANSRLVKPADMPRSYAYCSDTKYMPELHKALEGVTALYHEATYTAESEANALKYYHSTAAQAAKVARDAHVGKLILGHYSARYYDEEVLLREASNVFDNVILSNEGLIIDV